MKNTSKNHESAFPDEFKDHGTGTKHTLSKFEHDLYHDEDKKVEKILRVKRIALPNKGEKWKLFEDSKVVFVIDGIKLSKSEKIFLRSIDGINWLLVLYKSGITSFNFFKKELKKKLES